MSGPHLGPAAQPAGIDPRGPRFGAGVTAALLLIVVVLGDGLAGRLLLTVIVASFGLGVARGTSGTWQGALYRSLVRPRLGPPAELEDPRPPRFAQLVGLLVTGIGLFLALLGVPGALVVSAGLAFVAAFLNAAVGFCLGCEIYALLVRFRRSPA